MAGMSETATVTMDFPASSTSMAMDHGDMMGGCKISMLWNWNTVGSCFIARSWHITSKGMFAGSCIGVILLVVFLEALRRSVKEWDRYLLRQHVAKFSGASIGPSGSENDKEGNIAVASYDNTLPQFRPNVWQQAIRALLHLMQFAVAYFVMLLAMYFNGYIIICIFIGAYLGAFIFHWETLTPSGGTSAAKEAT
ncbi:Copper Transporter integral membrane protein that functions in high affinity copper transport [Fusarium chlamydosporum]